MAVFAYQHGGPKTVGLVGFGRWGAAAALAPWLALEGDRFPRRRVMVTADAVRTLALTGAAAGAADGWPPLTVYIFTGAVAAAASAFHPAESALRPSLARTPAELTAANVVSATVGSVATVVGPALGGLLLVLWDPAAVFAGSAVLLLTSASLVLGIRVRNDQPAGEVLERPWTAMIAGWAAIVADRRLRLLTWFAAAQLLVDGVLTVLLVVLAIRLLGLGQGGLGWLEASIGVGGIAGGLATAVLVDTTRAGRQIAVGGLIAGLPIVATGIWLEPAFALAALAIVGAGGTIMNVAGTTLVQRLAPQVVLARVSACTRRCCC